MSFLDQEHSTRASELDMQVEKLNKEKKDYVAEIKVRDSYLH